MPLEIERKFLVANDTWRKHISQSTLLVQGYFEPRRDSCVRIRIKNDTAAFLTIKNAHVGLQARSEYEYPIPVSEAREMLAQFCGTRIVRKWRHLVKVQGYSWEIDEFAGRHAPLVLAEIELATLDEDIPRPDWLGAEVTGNVQFANERLAHDGEGCDFW